MSFLHLNAESLEKSYRSTAYSFSNLFIDGAFMVENENTERERETKSERALKKETWGNWHAARIALLVSLFNFPSNSISKQSPANTHRIIIITSLIRFGSVFCFDCS